MSTKPLLLSALLVALASSIASAQLVGMPQREPNLTLRIRNLPAEGEDSVPQRLGDLPPLLQAARGEGHLVPGVIPYSPSATLWSDSSSKERYIALPDFEHDAPSYAQITYLASGGWDFPEHTVVVKNFRLSLDLRDPEGSRERVETRILVKHDGRWRGFSYQWNEAATDAELVGFDSKPRELTIIGEDGQPFLYTWEYPSRAECMQCHTLAANRVLGVNTAQMNYEYLYPSGIRANQIATFEHLGLFDAATPGPPDQLPRMPHQFDPAADIESRARAYLAANCGICHRVGVSIDASIDLTWEASNSAMNAIRETPNVGFVGLPGDAKIIFPGRPELSVLVARMKTLDPLHRMPRIGSRLVDAEAVALVSDWVVSLDLFAPEDLTGEASGDGVTLSWAAVSPKFLTVEGYNIYRSAEVDDPGESVNPTPVAEVSFHDAGLAAGTYFYRVTAVAEGRESEPSVQVAVTVGGNRFLRADCNADGDVDVSDPIASLSHQFLGVGAIVCAAACDANSDGGVDVSDPIATLSYLFLGEEPPGLFPACEIAPQEECAEDICSR